MVSGAFETIQLKAMYAWDGISSFGSKLGGMMTLGRVGGRVVRVTSVASKLGEAAVATGAWIAEHTAATATFIAENVAQAASATAAFIAENAATLGIAAAITALIAVVVWAGTHWHRGVDRHQGHRAVSSGTTSSTPCGTASRPARNGSYNDGHRAGRSPGSPPRSTAIETAALWLWHNVLDPVWQGIMAGVHAFESGILDRLGADRGDLQGAGELPDRHRLRRRHQPVLE